LHLETPRFEISVSEGVTAVAPAAWDALVEADDPFLEHAFLAALEQSGSVGRDTGWEPRFVLGRRRGELVAAAPAYIKHHGFGEFIFDWAWAHAAERAGIRYHPKLVVAVPFTPVTGARMLVRPDTDRAAATRALAEGLRRLADEIAASSIHVLFCRPEEARALEVCGFVGRLSMQFHWSNRAPEPFRDFEDWLETFSSRHRKEMRKERRVAASHGLRLETRAGAELDGRAWEALERFYRANADKHAHVGYLTSDFFRLLRERLAHRVVATLAYRGDEPVAGTLNFERGRHLYGRYWGCLEEHDRLHFELCYHRLIERSIARGLSRFEAGAGGEHKLARGLAPAFTHSAHWIRHPALAAGVRRFVAEEAEHVAAAAAECRALAPFKKG
jgi:hypothetical protein